MEQQTEQAAPAASAESIAASIEAKLANLGAPQSEEQETVPAEGTEETAPSQGEEQPAEQAKEASDDSVEVEFDGETYKVPTKLKEALMTTVDYTRKTQQLAEERRVVDAQSQMLQIQRELDQELSGENQQLSLIQAEIKRYNSADWSSMDTDTLVKTKHTLDQLKDLQVDLKESIGKKTAEFDKKRQESFRKLREAGEKALSDAIPGWSREIGQKVAQFGQNEGYTEQEIQGIYDPRMVKTLWKAMQWDNLQSSKPQVNQKIAKAPPVIKPGAAPQKSQSAALHSEAMTRLQKSGDIKDAAAAFLSKVGRL